MLILSRNVGEEVVIDHGVVVIKVLEVRGQRVRLGFTAPDGVVVNRREVEELVSRCVQEP